LRLYRKSTYPTLVILNRSASYNVDKDDEKMNNRESRYQHSLKSVLETEETMPAVLLGWCCSGSYQCKRNYYYCFHNYGLFCFIHQIFDVYLSPIDHNN